VHPPARHGSAAAASFPPARHFNRRLPLAESAARMGEVLMKGERRNLA